MEVRQGQGQSRYVCPFCGNTEYRAGRFELVPEGHRTYKGEERRLAEYCMAISKDPNAYAGICRGIMVWTPDHSATDLLYDGFEYDRGDGKGPQRISSLSEVRRIEHEAESMTRNEPGRAPIAFRNYSMDRKDQNAFHGSEFEKARSRPADPRTVRGQRIGARRVSGD